ncbi:competence type IV pilus minor pilin ComGD [Halalkalibacillus halophilus]|uniref:competence type IV pilus minor pilin ComGD n=1 Tax=Halalkalibacillus halophilus TaxID=392827 RepID=UPI000486E58B|nr:competence type IV pilus minor pilin ComGD [Halalkalibacillus halophilus]
MVLNYWQKDRGFTLIELLIVLSILIIVTLSTIQFFQWNITERKTQLFFHQFNQDVFFIQQHTMLEQKRLTLYFVPNENRYRIYENTLQPPIIDRSFQDVKFRTASIEHSIRFNATGTVVQPHSFHVEIGNTQYKITFPFGKGRYYVSEV